ncbi:adenosine kinase [Marinagarivorans algicola]|uniref:adenosine kinase n=1 Tax=Marinagarivorans algicola TaxID=1513270 RepID=UPI0037361567
MNNYGIYAIGAALVDTEIQINDADLQLMGIDKGVMTLVDEKRQQALLEHLSDKLVASERACGGSAANSVMAAQQLGSSTFFSCQVALDEHGKFYADDLIKAGVNTQAHRDAREGTTGKCLVMITDDAERTMNTHLGISETISIHNIDTDALKRSKFAYIEGYLVTSETGKPAAISVRNQAQAAGVRVAVSLSDPAIVEYFKDGIVELLGTGVDIIFCNQAEAMALSESTTIEDAADALKKYAKSFIITRGSEPTWVFDGERTLHVHTQPVKAIDTNGAGDLFAGAFLAAIDQGQSYADAAAFANRCAATIVSQFGPRLKAEQYAALKEHM